MICTLLGILNFKNTNAHVAKFELGLNRSQSSKVQHFNYFGPSFAAITPLVCGRMTF